MCYLCCLTLMADRELDLVALDPRPHLADRELHLVALDPQPHLADRDLDPRPHLADGELHLVALAHLALRMQHLAEVEEHARIELRAPDEPEAVLQRRDDALTTQRRRFQKNNKK